MPVRRARTLSGTIWEILLVQSRWTAGVWLFPKGSVERGETGKEAAIRETREEAGVTGTLGEKLGVWEIMNGNGGSHKMKMWILDVEEEFGGDDKRWKERKKRGRQWVRLEDAGGVIESSVEGRKRVEIKEILEKVKTVLEGRMDGGEKSGGKGGESADSDYVEE